MNGDLFQRFVLDCVSREDVDSLTAAWQIASCNKKEGEEQKKIISESIPKKYSSFKEYVQDVDVGRFRKLVGDEDPNCLLKELIKKGDLRNAKLCVQETQANLNYGLYAAAQTGNLDLVKFFIGKGAIDLVGALYRAAKASKRNVIDYLFSIGINDVSYGVYGAARGGDLELLKFFYDELERRNAQKRDFHFSTLASKNECVERAMSDACVTDNIEAVKFLVEKSGISPCFSHARHVAFQKNSVKIMEYFNSFF